MKIFCSVFSILVSLVRLSLVFCFEKYFYGKRRKFTQSTGIDEHLKESINI